MDSILLINQTYSTVIGVLFNVHSKQSQKTYIHTSCANKNAHAYTYIHTVNKHTNNTKMLKSISSYAQPCRPHTRMNHIYTLITIDYTYTRIHT